MVSCSSPTIRGKVCLVFRKVSDVANSNCFYFPHTLCHGGPLSFKIKISKQKFVNLGRDENESIFNEIKNSRASSGIEFPIVYSKAVKTLKCIKLIEPEPSSWRLANKDGDSLKATYSTIIVRIVNIRERR